MGMREFVHIHSSGRFDQSPAILERSIDSFMQIADLITMTEVSDRDRFTKLREKGWGTSLPSGVVRDDCGVAYKETTWPRELFDDTQVLSGLTYKNSRGDETRPQHGNFVVIEHANGVDRLLVAVTHSPHGMAQELRQLALFDKKVSTAVGKTYMADFRVFKRISRRLAKEFNCNARLLVSDFNIDIKKPWTREWFDKFASTLTVNWKKPFPRQGTLGRRIIDIALYDGLILTDRPRLLSRNQGEDHTPYKESFSFS